jgi:heme/copper-type cytochrome/quinol oxidase subunit 2
MLLQLLFISIVGLVAVYKLFSRTYAGRLFWWIYSSACLTGHLLYYEFAISYKVRTSGQRWSLMRDIYMFMILEMLLLIVIAIVWFFATRKKERTAGKIDFLHHKAVTILAPFVFVICIVAIELTYNRNAYASGVPVSLVEEASPPEPLVEELTYTSPEFGYTFTYPSSCSVESGYRNTVVKLEEGTQLEIMFGCDTDSLEEQLADRRATLASGFTNMLKDEPYELDGFGGVQLEYTFDEPAWHLNEITLDLDTILVVLQIKITSEASYQENYPIFDKIIQSLMFSQE